MGKKTNLFLNWSPLPDLVGIAFSDQRLKLAHARQAGGKIVFQALASKSIENDSDDDISLYLLEYLARARMLHSRVICSISSKFFISKNVEIPSTNRDEIAKIIDLQAGRFTPYSRDEIVIDFLFKETEEAQHYTSVLLIIINRKVVERYLRIFEKARIPLSQVTITSEAMSGIYARMAEAGQDGQAVAGLHVGEDFSDLVITDKGQMIFVRSISTGAQDLRDNPQTALPEFLNELNKSLTAYQDQSIGTPVRHLVLTGMMDDPPALRQAIQSSCPILEGAGADVKAVVYPDYFNFSEKVAAEIAAEKRISYFELLASLAAGTRSKIDLTPHEAKLKRRFRQSSKDMMTLGVLIMTLFLIVSCFLAGKIYIKNLLYDKLDSMHQSIGQEARSLEGTSTKNRVVRQLLENRGKGLWVFGIVSELLGEDVYLSNFSYQEDGKLGLVGTAQSMSKVFAFVTKLEESNYFNSVKAKQTKLRREGSEDVADFEIEAMLGGRS